MSSPTLSDPLSFARGPAMPNRLMLAPLTNQQSHDDGILSDAEENWLAMRADGGFGLVMTAAAHVQEQGQGFPGQLGIFGDQHLPRLSRLANNLRARGALSSVQLHHAGYRAPKELVADIVAPSDDEKSGARALTADEIPTLREAFTNAAIRADKAGFDGIQIHAAHGYIVSAFLSPELNRRSDAYGGSLENRAPLLFEIIDDIRRSCRPDFQIGVRLSPERFGQRLGEVVEVFGQLIREGHVDTIDLSLWDVHKRPEGAAEDDATLLLHHFTGLPRGEVRVGAAGKIMDASTAQWTLDQGFDFVTISKSSILEHDFARKSINDAHHASPPFPISRAVLAQEGASPIFIDYLNRWPNFVAD